MRLPSAAERRVLLLQRAAVLLFGPEGSAAYLHTFDPALGTTPAGAAWKGGLLARRVGEALRALATQSGHDRCAFARCDSCWRLDRGDPIGGMSCRWPLSVPAALATGGG